MNEHGTRAKVVVTKNDITGLKYFDQVRPLLERQRDVGCGRDKAGNRELHFDQYCLLVLLHLFNPICSSLRAVQQASELDKVQRRLGGKAGGLGIVVRGGARVRSGAAAGNHRGTRRARGAGAE